MEKVLTKTQELTKLLRTSKHLRDNDLQLIVKVWAMESGIWHLNTNPLKTPSRIWQTTQSLGC